MGCSPSKQPLLENNSALRCIKRHEYRVSYILVDKPTFLTKVCGINKWEHKRERTRVLDKKESYFLGLHVGTEERVENYTEIDEYVSYYVEETDAMKTVVSQIEQMLQGIEHSKSRFLHFSDNLSKVEKNTPVKVTPILQYFPYSNNLLLRWIAVEDNVEEDPAAD
jgi:hypothetical protein